MQIHLSDDFDYNKLLRFVAPSVIMMVFISLYNIVDGFFVSNYVGKTAFAAISIIMPVLMGLSAIGLMVGTGGSAVIGKTLGERDNKKACEYFSTLVYALILIGLCAGIAIYAAMRPVAAALGAEGALLEDCVIYGRIIALVLPFQMLQMAFSSFFIVAEKPKLGLAIILISGFLNMALDAVFIAGFDWGLKGAAYATTFSQTMGAFLALCYFVRKNDSLLQLTLKTRLYAKMLLQSSINGSSEMVGNIAVSVVTMLYNYQLMRFSGETGVAAYGVVMYVSFIFSAIFYGYTMGSAPIISYAYGAADFKGLRNIFRKSLIIMGITGSFMVLFVVMSSDALADIFVGYDKELFKTTVYAFHIFAVIFLIEGISIYSSGFFTALNNGKISAAIAFLRTFVFETSAVLIMPLIWGIDGIWWAIVVAETAAFIVSATFLYLKRNQYHYA